MASLFGSSGVVRRMRRMTPKVRFPFVYELKGYSLKKLRADLLAGATLTLVSIPQAIGFALILGLPPLPVIMSVMIGGFVGALFFSSHHHVFGPTSSVSLIVATTIASVTEMGTSLSPMALAIYMALLIGVVQFVAGLLNFGEITKFISRSVVIAYSSAIGLILVASQLHHFLGIQGEGAKTFIGGLKQAGEALWHNHVAWQDCAIGAVTFLIFEFLRRWRPKWPEALVALVFLGLCTKV
ncbi:MAG: hypothetical protein LBV12_01830, partial [Puniceicoccales bacterium]|nr:hypothetical protein [Puniceicoccales bacterium]